MVDFPTRLENDTYRVMLCFLISSQLKDFIAYEGSLYSGKKAQDVPSIPSPSKHLTSQKYSREHIHGRMRSSIRLPFSLGKSEAI